MKDSKAEVTAGKILDAALALFREQGFDAATMRGIAERAGVATGGAYYYYASKDAIVMDFYERANEAMQEKLRLALVADVRSLEQGLVDLIRVKLTHFGPNREVLRSLLRNGADPKHPLSPFSTETKTIRDLDFAWFQHVIKHSGVRVPRDLSPRLPGVLWFFQMGVILFWVTDDSPGQSRTEKLLPLACKVVASLVRLSSLPLMRPLRKPVLELIAVVVEE